MRLVRSAESFLNELALDGLLAAYAYITAAARPLFGAYLPSILTP
jgi:hypothetical protein